MILWICPNGSMGFQIFVSADPGVIAARPQLLMLSNKGRIAIHHRSEAQAYDLSKNGADIPRPTRPIRPARVKTYSKSSKVRSVTAAFRLKVGIEPVSL